MQDRKINVFLSFLEKKKKRRRDFGFVCSNPSWQPRGFNTIGCKNQKLGSRR